MDFAYDILDRGNIFQYHNGGPTINANVTYGPAIVLMLVPKPAKIFQDYADNILNPRNLRNFGVCESN